MAAIAENIKHNSWSKKKSDLESDSNSAEEEAAWNVHKGEVRLKTH